MTQLSIFDSPPIQTPPCWRYWTSKCWECPELKKRTGTMKNCALANKCGTCETCETPYEKYFVPPCDYVR